MFHRLFKSPEPSIVSSSFAERKQALADLEKSIEGKIADRRAEAKRIVAEAEENAERVLSQARADVASRADELERTIARDLAILTDDARKFGTKPRESAVAFACHWRELAARTLDETGGTLDWRHIGLAFGVAAGVADRMAGLEFWHLAPSEFVAVPMATQAVQELIASNAHGAAVEEALSKLEVAIATCVPKASPDPERAAVLRAYASEAAITRALNAFDAAREEKQRAAKANDPEEIRKKLEWQKRSKELNESAASNQWAMHPLGKHFGFGGGR